GGFVLWTGAWELFDLPPGAYTVEVTARDRAGQALASRTLRVLHGKPPADKRAPAPAPMTESTRPHPRPKDERPPGRREKLTIGTLFIPEGLRPAGKQVPLVVHFHGPTWLPEVAAARRGVAVVSAHLGSGSAVYGKALADPAALARLLNEAEA